VTTHRLVRLDAPAYWSRWDVAAPDGTVLGRIEKRGMSSAWSAHGADRGLIGTMFGTRAEAIAAVLATRDLSGRGGTLGV